MRSSNTMDGSLPPVESRRFVPLGASPFHPNDAFSGRADGVFRLGYRRWLDGLRGVAILLVLAYHLGFLAGGSLGVDVFFVLSGFLITALLLEEWQRDAAIRLRRFYLRRALRLLPAFITLLLLCVLTSLWLPSAQERQVRFREAAVAACYVANWPRLHQTAMPTLQHTWSLSVEEQFYLLWPALLYGLLRFKRSRRHILLLVIGGILASAALRLGLYHWDQHAGADRIDSVRRLYMGLDTRADALLVGCLLGLLAAWNLLPKSRHFLVGIRAASWLSLFGLGYLAWNRRLDHSQYYHGLFTGVALMVAVILVRLLSSPSRLASRVLESAPLVGIGRISYGLYLFHMPIVYWSWDLNYRWGRTSFALLVVVFSLAAALLSYVLIERPCLRLKDRMRIGAPPARKLPPVPATQAVA